MTAAIQQINERLARMETASLLAAKSVLTIEEAALLTGYAVKGIYQLTSEKRIPHYKKNGKLYFKKEELEAWMTENKVLTEAEVNSRAETYVATHKR